jgi:hypothetical protein
LLIKLFYLIQTRRAIVELFNEKEKEQMQEKFWTIVAAGLRENEGNY